MEISLRAVSLVPCFVMLSVSLFGACGEPYNSGEQKQGRKLSPEHISELLRKPDGLEKAADLVGHFEIENDIPVWSHLMLPSLVSGSSDIVIGSVEWRHSRLADDGDDIWTDYSINPLRMLKGRLSGSFSISAPGGCVTFGTGNSAQITTVQWRELQPGQDYMFFLQKQADGSFSWTNAIESVFKLSTPDGLVDAFAAHDGRTHELAKDVKGLTKNEFIAKVQAMIGSRSQ